MKSVPRIMIAALRSGSGKTSISTGLMGALAQRGYQVQGFKVGPDFIDPSYHTAVTGRCSRNLDTWMLPYSLVRHFFFKASAGADVAVVEGVMGLFDGVEGKGERASSAELAKFLGCPIILVIDARSQARSAVVEYIGCKAYDPDLPLVGAILNRVRGPRHLEMLEASFKEAGIPLFGTVFEGNLPRLKERYLGLVPVPEQRDAHEFLADLAKSIACQVNLDRVLEAARSVPAASVVVRNLFEGKRFCLHQQRDVNVDHAAWQKENFRANSLEREVKNNRRVLVAYAWDEAFNFYYKDGLDLLERLGVELVPFSPLKDKSLPSRVAGVIIGGGFPEHFAGRLAENARMKESLRQAYISGIPIYAECGGFMYLCETLTDLKGRTYPMVGLVPGSCRMERRLMGMGYVYAQALCENILCRKDTVLKGHEFHYSSFKPRTKPYSWAFLFRKMGNVSARLVGFASGNLLASYLHLHFAAAPGAARRFVSLCRAYKASILR